MPPDRNPSLRGMDRLVDYFHWLRQHPYEVARPHARRRFDPSAAAATAASPGFLRAGVRFGLVPVPWYATFPTARGPGGGPMRSSRPAAGDCGPRDRRPYEAGIACCDPMRGAAWRDTPPSRAAVIEGAASGRSELPGRPEVERPGGSHERLVLFRFPTGWPRTASGVLGGDLVPFGTSCGRKASVLGSSPSTPTRTCATPTRGSTGPTPRS